MKYYSEKTNKFYNSVKECIRAEEEFDIELAKTREAEKAAAAEEKALLEKVEAAEAEYENAAKVSIEAMNKYVELQKEYNKKYGHTKFTSLWDFVFGGF